MPSHSLPEEALLKLYHLLRDEPELSAQVGVNGDPEHYRELVRFWIDNRGNHHGRTSFTEYAQDHQPLINTAEPSREYGYNLKHRSCLLPLAQDGMKGNPPV